MIDNQCFSFAGQFIPEETFNTWSSSALKKLFPALSSNLKSNEFISYDHQLDFDKFKNKKILVIGGGPSTNDLDFDSIDVDYIFSANNFFMNEKINDIQVDIAMIGAEVDTNSDQFIEYVEKFQPWLGFELHNKWGSYDNNIYVNEYLYNSYPKLFCMQTRYYGCVGIGHRLLVLAMALQAKEISFVGIDGPNGMINGNHAFEDKKVNLPKLPKYLNKNNAEEIFSNAYKDFLTHVEKHIKYEGKIINLGKHTPNNIVPEYNC